MVFKGMLRGGSGPDADADLGNPGVQHILLGAAGSRATEPGSFQQASLHIGRQRVEHAHGLRQVRPQSFLLTQLRCLTPRLIPVVGLTGVPIALKVLQTYWS